MNYRKLIALLLAGVFLVSCNHNTSNGTSSSINSTATTTAVSDPDTPSLPDGLDNDAISSLIGTIHSGNGLLWYQFEEGTHATKLLSSLAQPRDSIELHATMLSNEGIDGDAIYFDGESNRVKLNNDFNNVSQITAGTFLHPSFTTLSVAFYFSPERLNGDQLLYEQGDQNAGLSIGIIDGKLTAAIAAGKSATSKGTAKVVGEYPISSEQLGQWIHVAVTYDGNEHNGTARLLIGGTLVAVRNNMGSVIPRTLDAAGLGAAFYGTNALGLTDAFFAGKMDDLRIYSTAIQPMGNLENDAVFLQSAAAKNAYLKASYSSLSCDYLVEPALRGWIMTEGLAGFGISLRLTGTKKYIVAIDDQLSIREISSDADKSAATFTEEKPLAIPTWGADEKSDFVSLKSADGYYITATDGVVTLNSSTTDLLSATFKKTGDQTNVMDGLRGAVYYPSYALNAPQFWKWYDHDLIAKEMSYANALGINAFRIWVSYEYWLEDSSHFHAGFNDFLELAELYEIQIMVSLFEGCGDNYSYDTVHTWSRAYTGDSCGWAITSPSAAIYNNQSRWEEPKAFVTWFIENFGNDARLMSIELYNEPWGTNRAALAKFLCEYAVTIQGSVPLIAGTAPADAFNIKDSVKLGMDQLQYHDNFPGNTEAFKNNAVGKIEQARLANLPIYCTEVQWVGGPSGINYPVYANLSATCNDLMETGKWAPFYWTLMVHPCYLNSYRNNYMMYNGLVNEDGTVNSLANAMAWANGEVEFAEKTVNPYNKGYYAYTHAFSDSFMDGKSYKWTAISGNWSADSGSYTGTGITTANDTEFTHFTATFTVKLYSGHAGLILGMTDDDNYWVARISIDKRIMEIARVVNGVETVLSNSSSVEIDAGAMQSVTVVANGDTVTISCNCSSVSAKTTVESGKIGFAADIDASFNNLHVSENPS